MEKFIECGFVKLKVKKKNEFSWTKIYGEVILRAGQVGNSFEIREVKARWYSERI